MKKPRVISMIKIVLFIIALVFTSLTGCSPSANKPIDKPEEKPEVLTITTEPSDAIELLDSVVKLKVVVTGSDKVIYQWQFSDVNAKNVADGDWKNVDFPGHDTDTLDVKVQNIPYRYRCLITTENGAKAESYAALVIAKYDVNATATITKQPKDSRGPIGSSIKLAVSAKSSGALTYQWQYSLCDINDKSDGNWHNSVAHGNKTATLTTKFEKEAYRYRCIITATNGEKTISYAALVKYAAKIVTNPKDTRKTLGSGEDLFVEAIGGGNLTYQWQYSEVDKNDKPLNKWYNVVFKGNEDTLTIMVHPKPQRYRCVITAENGSITTSYAALVKNAPDIYGGLMVEKNSNKYYIKVEFAPAPDTYTFQWQYCELDKNTNPTGKWKNSTNPGNTTRVLTVLEDTKPYHYRCVVAASNGEKTMSDSIVVPFD